MCVWGGRELSGRDGGGIQKQRVKGQITADCYSPEGVGGPLKMAIHLARILLADDFTSVCE